LLALEILPLLYIYIDINLTVVYKFIVSVDCDDDDDALPPRGEGSVFVLFTAGKEVVLTISPEWIPVMSSKFSAQLKFDILFLLGPLCEILAT